MKKLFPLDRSKWIAIGLVLVGALITVKSVTSYPHDCAPNPSIDGIQMT